MVTETERSVETSRLALASELLDAARNNQKKYTRVIVSCGVGKTYSAMKHYVPLLKGKTIVVSYNHQIVSDIMTRAIESRPDFYTMSEAVHYFGKPQPYIHYDVAEMAADWEWSECLRPPEYRYFPGCYAKCPEDPEKSDLFRNAVANAGGYTFKDGACKCELPCHWRIQKQEADKAKVIFTTAESLAFFPDRNIVIDETASNKLLTTLSVSLTKRELERYGVVFGPEVDEEIGWQDVVTYWADVRCNLEESYDKTSHSIINFFSSISQIQAYSKGETVVIFGRRSFMPESFKRVLYACATTPVEMMPIETGIPSGDWYIYHDPAFSVDKIENPVCKFKYDWNINMSQRAIADVANFMCSLPEHVLVITKLKFEDEIKAQLSDKEVEFESLHYGASRGTDHYNQKYSYVLMLGRFGFTPLVKWMMEKVGISRELTEQMEVAEGYQAVHRNRPILRPDTPYFLFSDVRLFPEKRVIEPKVAWRFARDFHSMYQPVTLYPNTPERETLFRASMDGESENFKAEYKKLLWFINRFIYQQEI